MAVYDDLRDAPVLITGGANGIGAAMVRAFAAQGARVFFCDVSAEAGSALASEMGASVVFARVNLQREKEIVRWIKQVAANGGIRVLINNAARDPRMTLESMSAADWDDLFATNLRAYFLTVREASPHMQSGASIINFASITFHQGSTPMSAYVATKGAVLGFSRSLARELGPRGIRVNTLSPGWIMTDRQLREFVTPEAKRTIRRSQCIPDFLQPDDIAEVALFLASHSSRSITGQELLCDRGWQHS